MRTFRDQGLEIRWHRETNREMGIGPTIELLDQGQHILFWFRNVRASQSDSLRSPGMRSQGLEPVLKEFCELWELARRPVEKAVKARKPKGRNLGAVDTLPAEFGRHLAVRHAAAKPK